MFGIGFQELLLILALALIVIGPKRLPEVARMLGKAALQFKKATEELRDSVQVDLRTDDELGKLRDHYRQVMEIPATAAAAVQAAVTAPPPPPPAAPFPEETAAPEGQPATPPQPAQPEAPGDEPKPSYRRNELEG